MRFVTVKNGLAIVALLGGLAILLFAVLPWVASTQIVRDRIAYELSLWSGYRVSLQAAPVLDIWPGFRARLDDVAFHEWNDDGKPPVLEAERLEVALSPLAALRGEVVLSAMSMHRPLLRLSAADPALPASPGGGRMMRAVEAARAVIADNPASPNVGTLPDIEFGTVEFFDGRIVDSDGDDDADLVTSLRGRIVWPSLNRPARLVANGSWRGENVAVELSATVPLLLLARGASPVSATLASALIEASFEGAVNLSGDGYVDGSVKVSSPSLRRMLEWSGSRIAPGNAIGAMSVASRVEGNASRLRLEEAVLAVGASTGRGVLDLSFADAVPAVSGTLAFDRIDLHSFLAAFTPAISGLGSIHDPIGTAFAEQLSLDLRLSSPIASFGAVTLSDIAASTQVKGNLTAFDISDATAFGGEMQAGLRIDGSGEQKTVEARLIASNVEALALARASGGERFLPQGRANISMMLKGTGEDWDKVMARAEGSVTATLGPGALAGFDLARFTKLWGEGGFFPLAEVSGGSLPLRGVDFKARISGGVARIEKADIHLEQQMVSVAGVVHYVGQALALSGYFAPETADGTPGQVRMPFFVGGSWDAPFVAPASADAGFD